MNLGKKLMIPQERELLINGGNWVPPTPEKPEVQRSGNVPADMGQNVIGSESWDDLVEIYTGLLQDETCDGMPQNHKPSSHMEHSREAAQFTNLPQNSTSGSLESICYSDLHREEHTLQNHNFVEACNQLHQNQRKHSFQDTMTIFSQEKGSIDSCSQNVECATPQKVDSLAELVGNAQPCRGANVMGHSAIFSQHSQVEIHRQTDDTSSSIHQKTPSFTGRQHFGNQNLQQGLNNGVSLPHQTDYTPNTNHRVHVTSSYLTIPLPFEPVTPDQQNKMKNHQGMKVPPFLGNEMSYLEKNKKDNVVDQHNEKVVRTDSGLDDTQGIPAILTSRENINSSTGNGEIELNKTPQQKPSKRRKHRPKVAGEGKQKRTPKYEASRKNSASKTPAGDKNQNGKNNTVNSTPLSSPTNEFPASDVESTKRTCRRALKFDLDNEVERVRQENGISSIYEQNKERSRVSFDLNSDPHSPEKPKQLNGVYTSTITPGHAKEDIYNLNKCVNHIPLEEVIPAPPMPSNKDHNTLNLIARSVNARHSNVYQNGSQNRSSHTLMMPQHHVMSKKFVHSAIEANTNRMNLENISQLILQTSSKLPVDAAHIAENQECRRGCSTVKQGRHQTVVLMGSSYSIGSSKRGPDNSDNIQSKQSSSETIKRRRIEDIFHGTSSSMSSRITAVEDCSGQIHSRGYMSCQNQSSAVYMNYGLPNTAIKGKSSSRNPNCDANKVMGDLIFQKLKDFKQNFSQQQNPAQIHSLAEKMAEKTSNQHAQVQSPASQTAVTNWILKSANQRGVMTHGYEIMNSYCKYAPIYNPLSCRNEVSQKNTKHPNGGECSSKRVTVSRVQRRKLFSVDVITESMKNLHIYDNAMEVVQKEQHALVRYVGAGAIVSSEAFDQIKKRHPRPKVDLDPETNRVWNLLMGKEGESTEQIDRDRQKWWEKERDVLRIRADSFIARMHLVQGDRRFSRWKGSVVDSVIGVFLTQNVSDHLSSSAFMALASKFPLKSMGRETSFQTGINLSPEPQKVLITYPDGTTSDHRMMSELVYNPISATSSDSFESEAENINARTRSYLINDDSRRLEEDIISSQSSSDSVIFQASEDIRSSSGSNSEAEDQITGWNFSKNHGHPSFSGQSERITAFKTYQVKGSCFPNENQMIGNQHLEDSIKGQLSEEIRHGNACPHPFSSNPLPKVTAPLSMSYKPNIQTGAVEKLDIDVNVTYGTTVAEEQDISERNRESNITSQQNGRLKLQSSTANPGISNKLSEQKNDFLAESQSRTSQHFTNCKNERRQETLQPESKFLTDHRISMISITNSPSEKLKHSENIAPEPVEMSQTQTSGARKQMVDKEKTGSFNWDSLRKKVQSDTGKRVRKQETLDTMDYEAIRRADVHEIAKVIRERGMNNMLAERIKAFLNRMVTDHEKIDLEWLRDVQPDKVKDYLLSIRGLGLKSVECVRLLTLHNVAFPVDTNVGRIAVRLGWVPLRPLPESLQLHLLELYPVLESIQKYLWPRLCHLDQETLYELHYQMITFGKVFCTKRDPNCNACPMRGDCRHFASAYASTRLALPGPQEQQIVGSMTQGNSNKNSDNIIKSSPFLQALTRENGSMRNNEPFVEEPTTPETTLESPEKDIEDICFEDPDKIPEIKLNIEEFTSNLQSIIQENKEMQGDMSKALVVLRPEHASIPMPKLKQASKLRTEHRVYELPDSHPVLKGLDKREPDDPSPYLLVIQSMGDTENSVAQSSESKCTSLGLDSCDKKACYSSITTSEANAQTIKCSILIPCRTAMRGSFPLNGTYFQVNEVFADHESSINPIVVPTRLLWKLPRRTVFFGTSVSTIFKGLTTEAVQHCFWRGFVCVRGFDRVTRAPRPLGNYFHHPASKMARPNQQ